MKNESPADDKHSQNLSRSPRCFSLNDRLRLFSSVVS